MNNSYITIIKEKRTALSRKRIPLNQNGCTANFRIGVPFEQNLHNKLHVGNRAELKGCPVAKVTHKKKDDYMTSLEFTEGVYNQPIKMVTIYFQDGSIRNETPLTEANIES